MLEPTLTTLLRQSYDLGDFTVLQKLVTSGHRRAYLLETERGKVVLKITDPNRPEGIVKSDIGILAYLEGFHFPAPRPIPAAHGSLYLPYENHFLYLYSFIQGEPPTVDEAFFRKAGELLARLHSIPVDANARISLHRPPYVLEEVKEYLEGTPHTEEQQRLKAEILELIKAFPSFEGLPEGLIHTDPYFINFVSDSSGCLWLIDWEDGGISYPLIDVGYIGHLTTYLPHDREKWQITGAGEISTRYDWAQLFLDAYQSVRPLTALEKELFPAAVRLNYLIYLWEWGERRIIPENFRRMKMMEEFHPKF